MRETGLGGEVAKENYGMNWQDVLRELGTTAVIVGAIAYVSQRVVELWLAQRLQAHKTSLDNASSRALEQLRSSLSQDSSDFTIYAARRHDATADLFASLLRAENLANDFRAPSEAEAQFGDDRNDIVTSRVTRARNDAYETFYANVLYLTDELEGLAKEVIFQFHDLLTEHMVPSDTPNQDRGRARRLLRMKMEQLQTAARSELARSRLAAPSAT
jgi:hypothetical protein